MTEQSTDETDDSKGSNYNLPAIDPDYLRDNRPDPTAIVRPDEIDLSRLSRRPGDGAGEWSDDKKEETARRPSNDGRSQTRTMFYTNDVSDTPVDYERLAKINDGVQADERSAQNHDADKYRIIEALASALDCTQLQTDRAAYLVDNAGNLQERFPTRSVEEVALAAITLAIDADVTDFDRRATNRDRVHKVMADVGIEDVSELFAVRRKLV